MKNSVFAKVLCGASSALLLLASLSGCAEKLISCFSSSKSDVVYTINDTSLYDMTDTAVVNPFMGFAASATNKKAAESCSLVYIDVTFKELQPSSSEEFDFETIARENNIDMWKAQGKHAVLRFVCDVPTDEEHSDIPDWLMEMTGDGAFYDTSYGKGYSPNYTNEVFIKYHEKALQALAEYFDDGFVCYVQLGSLGHWGEWHVKKDAGIAAFPGAVIRKEYVSHYTDAFTNAKLMMRRPFSEVKEFELGIYNDMLGSSEDAAQWLDWIEYGGEYSQTGEKNALAAVPDFWKAAPSGGEFTSSVPMQKICVDNLAETLDMLKASHTTFIGPKIPISYNGEFDSAVENIISSIGYRLGITEVTVKQVEGANDIQIELVWENSGIAPIYFDLPVNIYTQNADGGFEKCGAVDINLSEVLPNKAVRTETTIPASIVTSGKKLYIGILDPMTNVPSVSLVSNQPTLGKYIEIYK